MRFQYYIISRLMLHIIGLNNDYGSIDWVYGVIKGKVSVAY